MTDPAAESRSGHSPLVSVVLPTYDRNEYLPEAVRTVTVQTYEPVELVVVDDCSPTPASETLATVDTSSLASVTCLRHAQNRGANAARNTGTEAASGDYLAFLDDDDEWDPEKLERQVDTFRSASDDVGVVYTGTRYVDTESDDELVITPTRSGDVTRGLLCGQKFGEFSVMMVRADVLEAAGPPDERFPSWQDREWYLRLSTVCEFAPVPEPLTVRHIGHGDQISDDYEAKRDVSYPLLVEKHRSLAASKGSLTERRFLASLSAKLGRSALRNNYYADARRYLGRSIRLYPFTPACYLAFLAALGGRPAHRLGKRLVRSVRALV